MDHVKCSELFNEVAIGHGHPDPKGYRFKKDMLQLRIEQERIVLVKGGAIIDVEFTDYGQIRDRWRSGFKIKYVLV